MPFSCWSRRPLSCYSLGRQHMGGCPALLLPLSLHDALPHGAPLLPPFPLLPLSFVAPVPFPLRIPSPCPALALPIVAAAAGSANAGSPRLAARAAASSFSRALSDIIVEQISGPETPKFAALNAQGTRDPGLLVSYRPLAHAGLIFLTAGALTKLCKSDCK